MTESSGPVKLNREATWMRWPEVRYLSFNLTYACNFACVHCYIGASADHPPLRYDCPTIRRIAREAKELGIVAAFLAGGEPLLLHELPDFVHAFAEQGITTYISTNMSPLTLVKARDLLKAGLTGASVGIDHVEQALFDAFRGAGAFEKVMYGLEICRESDLPVNVDFTLTRRNRDALQHVHRFAAEIGAERVTLKRFVPEGKGFENREALMLSPSEHRQALIQWAEKSAECVDRITSAVHDPLYPVVLQELGILRDAKVWEFDCNAGGGTQGWLGISPNGDIHPCPLMRTIRVGNVFECSLQTALEHVACESISRHIPNECRDCDAVAFCRGGCKSCTVRTVGLGMRDPLCWRAAGGKLRQFI